MRLIVHLCCFLVAGAACLAPAIDRDEDKPLQDVPFHLAGGHNPLILVPVYVEGKGPFQFILDTGAFRCLLSPQLAATLGVRTEALQLATGVGGNMRISSAHLASLVVGSARQENVEVAITGELSRFGDAVQSNVDGVIGFNFLKDFRLSLDYELNVLRLAQASTVPAENNQAPVAASIPFKLATPSIPLILLPVLINGRGPFQFVLDTGTSRTTLSFDLARKLGIVAIGDRSATGAGGKMKMFSGSVDLLSLGKVCVRDFDVSVGEFFGSLHVATGTVFDGIIGNDFISHFAVMIDYPRRTISLTSLRGGAVRQVP